MIDLDQYLNPAPSPINSGSVTTPYDFGFTNERDAVGNFNLKNFSFSKGTGGTLQLGGTANGNGLMTLKDASGVVIMQQDNTGQHFYNSAGTESIRVDLTGFHAYGSTGTELIRVDNTGLHAYINNGTSKQLDVLGTTINFYGTAGNTMRFYDRFGGTEFAIMGYTSAAPANFLVDSENGAGLMLISSKDGTQSVQIGALGTGSDVVLSATHNVRVVANDLLINGVSYKLAIVSTSKGYRALYCMESPEVWFMDFCKRKKSWKFWEQKFEIDPLFIEATSPPYHYVKCEGNIYQVWGKRKGAEKIRFEEKTKEQFEKNNQFWSTPLK